MSQHFKHLTIYFVVFAIIIDRGDGRWKRKDREKLEQDIAKFRKMSENVEHDIEDFYDDYPDEESVGDISDETNQDYYNKEDKRTEEIISESSEFNAFNQSYERQKDIKVDISNKINEPSTDAIFTPVTFKQNKAKDENIVPNSSWPRFEDILLAIGKRYDWKNDRWIKVKEKVNKTLVQKYLSYKNSDFISKHRFNYRTVKLNRSKSKRNVIIAVKAIR